MIDLNKPVKFYGGGPSEAIRKDLHALRNLRNGFVHGHDMSGIALLGYKESFKEEYKAYLLLQKRERYARQLKSFHKKLAEIETPAYPGSRLIEVANQQFPAPFIHYYQQKIRVLEKLLDHIDQLFASGIYTQGTLAPLEARLGMIIDPLAWLEVPESWVTIAPVNNVEPEPKGFIDYVLQQLRNYLKHFFKLLKRDLRQSFRQIIQLIFKNMDDESGDGLVASAIQRSKQDLLIQKIKHEQRNDAIYPQWAPVPIPGAYRRGTPRRR